MENLIVVRIINSEKYKLPGYTYGILVQSMEETAIVNFSGNKDGNCINIAHSDYAVVSPNYWNIVSGEVVIRAYGGYVYTGLKIW